MISEEVTVKCINEVAIMRYKNSHDKWWLKLAIYTQRRIDELAR